MDSYIIICRITNFTLKHKLIVLNNENKEIVEEQEIEIKYLPNSLINLAQHYNTYTVQLAGNPALYQGIIKEVQKQEIVTYSETKIKFI